MKTLQPVIEVINNDPLPSYPPMRILEVELGSKLPALSALDEETGKRYQRALCTVLLHAHLLGTVELPLPTEMTEPAQYAPLIWQAMQDQINAHLREDGLPSVSELGIMGITNTSTPACEEARARVLANAPFVSVIVPTRERPEMLTRCLSTILQLRYPNFEIVVVDNAPSSDATYEAVQQLQAEAANISIRYVRENRPGTSFTRNAGILAARGEILACCDDDVKVDSNWLVELVRSFQEHEHVGCVTGTVLTMELETPTQFLFEEYGSAAPSFVPRIIDTGKNHPHTPLFPFALGKCGVGANMAFRAEAIRQAGGFDLALGSSGPSKCGQDIDSFVRVVLHGYTLVYNPNAFLYHQQHREFAKMRKQVYNYGIGFTAMITKLVCCYPGMALRLILQSPPAIFAVFVRIFSQTSEKNQSKSSHFPPELTKLELKGMAYGPLAYLQTRWKLRHASRQLKRELAVALTMGQNHRAEGN